MRKSAITDGPPPVKEFMTLMAAGDEPEDDEVIIRAERAVGGKDLYEFFPRLVRTSKPLSTTGATGTEPEMVSEPEHGSDNEEDQGQGRRRKSGAGRVHWHNVRP